MGSTFTNQTGDINTKDERVHCLFKNGQAVDFMFRFHRKEDFYTKSLRTCMKLKDLIPQAMNRRNRKFNKRIDYVYPYYCNIV